ncbi:hypothetical protein [Deminuibacter soli]|uniref:Uncharacterized protein n=1 Tax=Deminuibacter soli TaxID=2291815 RepID=A0A3E1NPX7_9BACT|nr:hypothetical protein [Deminuibacter soli]RFM29973.1 hypothetical protein DXN05_03085 [Deminuibacter soli]
MRVQVKKILCYKLVATDEAREKLRTKGGPVGSINFFSAQAGFTMVNHPLTALINDMELTLQLPVINETRIEGNIDLDIVSLPLSRLRNWQLTLRANGLDLICMEVERGILMEEEA